MPLLLPAHDGRRPSSGQDCFYCAASHPEHTADCVCRQRAVVVEMTLQYFISVPESWTAEDIEFHRNDSSWCSGNAFDELAKLRAAEPKNTCTTCARTSFKFVREGTAEDTVEEFPELGTLEEK